MNVVETGHSYGDIMLYMKAQEAKQVCFLSYWLQLYLCPSYLIAFWLLKFICFPLYKMVKLKLENQVSGWFALIIHSKIASILA